jgi:hypothetical protein
MPPSVRIVDELPRREKLNAERQRESFTAKNAKNAKREKKSLMQEQC